MASIEAMINWMYARQGVVTYSMAARNGPNSYDCSSAVYTALVAGEFLASGTMGNTTSLPNDLVNNGWTITTTPQRGDIFVWTSGTSGTGRYGHTGIFVDSSNVIHCTSSVNGITVVKYTSMLAGSGNPTVRIYRCPEGTTQPELNTDEERVAWAVANVLYGLGYELVPIAGILGNAVVESKLKPDAKQSNGGGYGLVQWDGSAYPLVGSKTSDGREYVKRLMNAAGLSGDYTAAEPQARLIDWCMYNGQWIGAVEPKTVADFKVETDITTATTAFMKNFERPGVEKLSERIEAANTWYTFLSGVDVEVTGEETTETLTNVGALDYLGIADGRVIAQGWHFSSDKDIEYIVFMNAETGEEIETVQAETIVREDLLEAYPNVINVENSGFDVSIEVPNGTAVYVKAVRTDGTNVDELVFDSIIIYERAFDPEVESYAKTNNDFFFEIWNKNKLKARGNKILNTLSWANELMSVPVTSLDLPIEYKEHLVKREEIKIYINQKVFHGIITDTNENKVTESLTVDISHVVSEWEYRQVSTNLAAKNRTVNDIYSTLDFRYDGWNVEYLQDSASRIIDYVYSRQSKLDGLTKTCELTDDLFWRVGFNAGRTLDIGTFGDKVPYMLSTKPGGKQNIQILGELSVRHKIDSVINMATVYGEKSDSGMSSMSLREMYEDPEAQDPNFPVVILKNGINNERGYDYIEFSKLAPNNDLEYTVIDTEGIALEGATAIEGTFPFNDLAPFNTDGEEVTDEDRAKASKTAYDAAVKKLKQSRRRYIISLQVAKLPYDVNVGDKIRFIYDNSLLKLDGCSNYEKKILRLDDWFYITSIEYNFDKNGIETNTLSLEKALYIDRESDVQ